MRGSYIFMYKCTNACVLLLYLCINVQKRVYFCMPTCKYINMHAFLYIYVSAFTPTCVFSQLPGAQISPLLLRSPEPWLGGPSLGLVPLSASSQGLSDTGSRVLRGRSPSARIKWVFGTKKVPLGSGT